LKELVVEIGRLRLKTMHFVKNLLDLGKIGVGSKSESEV